MLIISLYTLKDVKKQCTCVFCCRLPNFSNNRNWVIVCNVFLKLQNIIPIFLSLRHWLLPLLFAHGQNCIMCSCSLWVPYILRRKFDTYKNLIFCIGAANVRIPSWNLSFLINPSLLNYCFNLSIPFSIKQSSNDF